jgi:hypothetical protein
MRWFGGPLVALVLGGACSELAPPTAETAPEPIVTEVDPPDATIPGPLPLESDAQMRSFLAGGTFLSIPEREDSWRFGEDGRFEARYGAEVWTGRWRASRTQLFLSDLAIARDGADPEAVADRTLDLVWLDGKLNIEIEGRQFRSNVMR